MSADLLAEFDSYYGAKSSSQVWGSDDHVNPSTIVAEADFGRGNAPSCPLSGPLSGADHQHPWGAEPLQCAQQGDDGQPIVEDNDWGEFENAQTTGPDLDLTTLHTDTSQTREQPGPAFDPWGGFDNGDSICREPINLHTDARSNMNQTEEGAYFPRPQPLLQPTNSKHGTGSIKSARSNPRPVRDENILFDADDVTDDDEDFGTFAEPGSASKASLPIEEHDSVHDMVAQASLIDLDDTMRSVQAEQSSTKTQMTVPSSEAVTSVPNLDPFADLDRAFCPGSTAQRSSVQVNSSDQARVTELSGIRASVTSSKGLQAGKLCLGMANGESASSQRPTTAFANTTVVESETYDAWGEWEDQDLAQQVTDAEREEPLRAILDLPPLLPSSKTTSKAAPTNVPPPALLLSIFPTIFEVCQAQLLKPLAAVSQHDRDIIVSEAGVQDFLHSYLAVATVLARIIAGRKLRWKRDTLLAQSMRIGQAGAKTTGMKLASLDRSEDTREEREVTNVVRLWKLQVGKLRTALTAAGISANVPEIAKTLPVRTGQANEGATTAPKQCVLCALKRDERVHKADVDVQDSFGEWWIEHWGHRSCKDFWDSKEQELRSR